MVVRNSLSGCSASEITSATAGIATASTPNTSFRLIPPANIITQNKARSTILVERSGCLYTSAHGSAIITIQQPIIPTVFKFFLCFIINCAKNKINIIFAVSEGWKRKLPICSQRWAPWESDPNCQTAPRSARFPTYISQYNFKIKL